MSPVQTNGVAAAFTEEQAARLTGVSRRQLGYWARDFYPPGIRLDASRLASLRLYSFRDLVCLKVLNALRNDANIPLQELRRTKDRLAHLGEDLWATVTLYVLGKRVVFDNPATGALEEVATGQGVLQIPLQIVAGQMHDAVQDLRNRQDTAIGKIVRRPSVAQNQPVISGTRIPVRSIKAFAKAGYTVGEINRQYPSLELDDIEAAIGYEEVA